MPPKRISKLRKLQRKSRLTLILSFFSGFLLFLVVSSPNSYGQDEPAKSGAAEEFARAVSVEDLVYRVKGADIPRYHLVNAFLLRLSTYVRTADDDSLPNGDEFYELFLSEIGVAARSGAESALRRAAARLQELKDGPAGPIVETREGTEKRRDGTIVPTVTVSYHGRGDGGPEIDWKDDENVVRAKIQAHHAKKAQELADIYYDLLVDLTNEGVLIENIERYLYNNIAAHSSLASDEPFDRLRPFESAFEERLKTREADHLRFKKEE